MMQRTTRVHASRAGLSLSLVLVLFFACSPGSAPDPAVPVNGTAAPSSAALANAASALPAAPAPAASILPPARKPQDKAAYDALIEEKLSVMEKIRGLTRKKGVRGRALSRKDMIAEVRANVLREVPMEAIEHEGLGLKLMGLIPPNLDYTEAAFKLLEEELAGFYSPVQKEMYLVEDLPPELAEVTLLHELVHALQDQTWDLEARSKYRPGEGDKSFARSALAEGDATRAMLEPMLSVRGATPNEEDELFEQLFSTAGAKSATTPRYLQRSLVAPYLFGVKFVNQLKREGGWPKVNAAWQKPPLTSQQIMHVEHWKKYTQPVNVAAPNAAALGRAGGALASLVKLDEDTAGELGLALVLDEWLGGKTAHGFATGWRGDRGAMWASPKPSGTLPGAAQGGARAEEGQYVASAEIVQFSARPDESAIRTAKALAAALPSISALHDVGSLQAACVERPDLGPLVIAQKGNLLWISAGPARITKAIAAGSTETWSSGANCKQAEEWARENLETRGKK
jgi:hypothetical protein